MPDLLRAEYCASGRRSDGERASVRPKEIDPQLPAALEVAAEMGDTDPEELASIVLRALQLPDLAARLKTLLAEDGMSPELHMCFNGSG